MEAALALAITFATYYVAYRIGRWVEQRRIRRDESRPGTITDGQITFIRSLCRHLRRELPNDVDGMSRIEALELIDRLIADAGDLDR